MPDIILGIYPKWNETKSFVKIEKNNDEFRF
jgi:hypothetical protein